MTGARRSAMLVAALSAGAQAPRGRFNGIVHSVFRHACNLRLDDGRLLALLAPHLGNVPHGVRLEVPAEFDFARRVWPGQRVGCRADVLRIERSLSTDLAMAQPWRSELPAAVDLTNPKVALAWRTAWHALRRARPTDGALALLAREIDREGFRLARAARCLQADQAASALDRLIGRGPGLTPSGDDLIVGLLAGLWSTRGNQPARRTFLANLCTAVAAAAAATGEISRVYLAHAAQGHFAEPLTTLAHRIAEGADRGVVECATTVALRVGHTSGADGISGLLLGVGAWAPRPAPWTLARPVERIAVSSSVEPGSLQQRHASQPAAAVLPGSRSCGGEGSWTNPVH